MLDFKFLFPIHGTFIEADNFFTPIKTGVVSNEKRYYISSSSGSAEEMLHAVRGHWEVENKLHWVLDFISCND
ncbi:MAG: hypothetical protein A2504_10600 [Bdellovibrionales bacterium RIFOXYD12_FULL_39_22]|nr:MAG: hypothetical protein A2385_14235 [Bdellovibrionales bacterium RIFOXYB1_FULL_39_21]OFZ40393.1 MAG: hypothetical protein A2485_02925 [Bdellovibrionales bacterium RIFOXYC12_FULL_39_17]OFZ49642.1 MAG: hypothetical protein A2404_09385 [Bdellovibrionales bacterium RIFOXYC1_FULL_39_130]OFZ74339.1 MAG: hypothetical protein A2451_03700 [Bdellovibrionales bacterium RIFOXYC2_FULL_39_8]OFZ77312.1 MAG: hypothetical protein A2560_06050 [Bdellovibrionales bacterium RIFOXYD1_FULL_39_84]OFZ95967.1 MAG: